MNILFLNVGRRCEIVKEFKKVLPRFQGVGLVYGSDINPLAPALKKVDRAVIFPHCSNDDFDSVFIGFCRENKIKLVIPTIDPDLHYISQKLSHYRKELSSTMFLVPEKETVALTEDKRKTKEFFQNCGALVPEYLDPEKISNFPVFIKPACGSASEGAQKILNRSELFSQLKLLKNPMVEELVEGPEYTVDVFCDRSLKARIAIPRKRIAVRGGEVSRGIVERNPELESLSKKLAEVLGVGIPITIQFRKSQEGFVAMEVNARIGGGLPLTIAAGGAWPLWILQMASGQIPVCDDHVRDGLLICRYDESVFMQSSDAKSEIPNLEKVKLIVFDMDDTLYAEREFVFSAYRIVSDYVLKKFNVFIEDELRRRFSEGQRGDLFSVVLNDLGIEFTEDDIKELVNVYRSHKPNISPYSDTAVIPKLRDAGYKIGLISDGWSSVQKNKWEALGLQKYFDCVVFTDDFGLEFWKPSHKPFAYICEQAGVKFEEAVYIADNPAKDFKAPNELGMKSIRVRRFGGEYSSLEVSKLGLNAEFEVSSLLDLICTRSSVETLSAKA